MKAPEDRLVRPTLRCLTEDLGNEVGPSELRDALSSAEQQMAEDPRYLFPVPLASAQHIVLDKANMLARDPAAEREPIKVIGDRATVKVKTADRRGALRQDADGTWWLLAAGRRKDDGSGDFYQGIASYASNSDSIAPTETDHRYHRYEAAYIAEADAERDAQVNVIRTLLDAAATPGTACSVDVFGARIAISIDPEDDDSGMLSMSFDFTSFKERDRFPVDVIGFVPGYESIDDWDILPPLRNGDPECWYAYVSESWIDWLATAVELDELVEDSEIPPTPSVSAAGQLSHRALASVVTLAYVEGVEITAICGARFTPTATRMALRSALPAPRRLLCSAVERPNAPRLRSADTGCASSALPAAIFSSGRSFESVDTHAAALAEDRHHGLRVDAKRVADSETRDTTFLAQSTEVGPGHSE